MNKIKTLIKFSFISLVILLALGFTVFVITSNAYNTLAKEKLRIHKDCYDDTPAKYNQEFSERKIIDNEQTIDLWEMKSTNKESKKVFLFIHGYGGVKGGKTELLPLSLKFIKDGDLILMDLPSFCNSSGDEITLGEKESKAIKKTIDYLNQMYTDSGKEIVIVSYSLGAYSSAKYSYDINSSIKIVAVNPYYSIPDVLSESMPIIRPILVLSHPKENLDNYARKENIIIISGSKDNNLKPDQRTILKNSIKDRYIELEDQDHTSVLKTNYLDKLYEKIIENIK